MSAPSEGGPVDHRSSPPRRSLTLAVAQPPCTPCDVAVNAAAHASIVLSAAARVVVFPELSLTGYELDAAPIVRMDDTALDPLIEACAVADCVALVGAPVGDTAGRTWIAMLAVTARGVDVVYRKIWLGSEERQRFHPGPTLGPDDAVVEVDGWRLGLAICKDTSVPAHTAALAASGIDVYVAGLVMHPAEAAEQDERGTRITRATSSYVAFASFAGPTGSGYPETAGRSSIWAPDGSLLARTSGPEQYCRATLQPRPRKAVPG